jgi:ABC-type Fe3+/spermidine/putrescine transport system ATPase subunit
MPSIALRSLRNYVLKDVSFSVDDGEFMVLLGRNGAGKSTLLNIIAGLTDYRGSVLFDNRPVDGMGSEKRNVGYLFQQLALFPHMNVSDNIGYGLRVKGGRRRLEIAGEVDALLEMFKIEHIGSRYPRDLSGGEKQRVALARALAAGPEVLLMDEPFNSLDLRSAKYLRMDFRRLHRKLGATTIFVTHNLTEASEIADRIAVIDNGRLLQIGTPDEVVFDPADEGVQNFIGEPNIFTCQSSRVIENGLALAKCGEMAIVTPHEGKPIRKIAIAPEHVYVSTEAPAGPRINRFQGVVEGLQVYPSTVRLSIGVGGRAIVAELPRKMSDIMGLYKGIRVHIILKLRWLQVLNG